MKKYLILLLSLSLLLLPACGAAKTTSEVSDTDLDTTYPEVSDSDLELLEEWKLRSAGLAGQWGSDDYRISIVETQSRGYWDFLLCHGEETLLSAVLYWDLHNEPVLSYTAEGTNHIIGISCELTAEDELLLTYREGDPLLDLAAGESLLLQRIE